MLSVGSLCFSHRQQRLYGAAMASSVAVDESLRERCTRYRRERDIAYSDVDHFKDANARLSTTVRDLEETVARLCHERNEAQDKLTELR